MDMEVHRIQSHCSDIDLPPELSEQLGSYGVQNQKPQIRHERASSKIKKLILKASANLLEKTSPEVLFKSLKSDFWNVFEKQKILNEIWEALNPDTVISYLENEYIFEAKNSSSLISWCYRILGNLYLKKSDSEMALECYHKAFALNPNNSWILNNLGAFFLREENWILVSYYFREALRIDSQNDQAWCGLSVYHYYLGDRELAIANAKKALDINPSNRLAIVLLFKYCGDDQKNFLKAILIKYLSYNPFDEEISLIFIKLCLELSDYGLAEVESFKLLLCYPDNQSYAHLHEEILRICHGKD